MLLPNGKAESKIDGGAIIRHHPRALEGEKYGYVVDRYFRLNLIEDPPVLNPESWTVVQNPVGQNPVGQNPVG